MLSEMLKTTVRVRQERCVKQVCLLLMIFTFNISKYQPVRNNPIRVSF